MVSTPYNDGPRDVEAGKTTTFVVYVDARPDPTVEWYKDNQVEPITPSSKYVVHRSWGKTYLKIRETSVADNGVYRLVAISGKQRKSLNFTLVVDERPYIFICIYTWNSVNVFFNSFPKMIQNGLNQWWWVGAIRLITSRLFSGSIHSRPSLDFRSFNADLHSRVKRLPGDPAKMYTRMNLLIIWNKSIIWFKFVNQDETVWDVDTFRQIDRKGHIALEPLTIYIKNGGEGERFFFVLVLQVKNFISLW